MQYIDIGYYESLYNDIDEARFNRLVFDACRKMDYHTTGADGVKKLRVAFPEDAHDAEAVKRCAAKVLNVLSQIEDAEQAAAAGRGYTETDRGLQRKVVARVEAGNEAISYMEANGSTSAVDKAAIDAASRESLLAGIIREYLSGVCDANGVNLLYMGPYPRVR